MYEVTYTNDVSIISKDGRESDTIVFNDGQQSVLKRILEFEEKLSSKNSQGSFFDRRQTSGLI